MDGFNCETAKCFVPEMLVTFIDNNLANGKDGLEPSSFFLNGVCLLVDISGFTKLSGEFCDLGKSGIDELQLATNGYMGKLVEIIYTYGGEVIKFAGDAIICVFSARFITSVTTQRNKGGKLRSSVSNFQNLLTPSPTTATATNSSSSSSSIWDSGQPHESSINMSNVSNSITVDAIIRAMLCADELRKEQTDKLSVHVAMSCGEMCFGVLGGVENRWECLISGPCLHELSACLDDAPSKEAVMSRECAAILVADSTHAIKLEQCNHNSGDNTNSLNERISRRHSYIVETGSGCYQMELEQLPTGNQRIVFIHNISTTTGIRNSDSTATPSFAFTAQSIAVQYPQSLKLIRQFVPLPIAEEIEAGMGLAFIAEIREVTTMFMKWESYDPTERHRDLRELQQCFFCAQEILHSTGAYLRQFLVDDKGCVLIACWGMPHLSYLDNASRGMSAAAQIRAELNKLDMSCSFGITTGDVYCGTVGSAVRMEYAAIGSVVNMSARLMGKANGGILIDDATYSHLPGKWKELVTALDPIKVKGREEPLQVYSYVCLGSLRVKEKTIPDHEIPVGCREALLQLLCDISETQSRWLAPVAGIRPKKQRRQSSVASMQHWIASAVEAAIHSGGRSSSSENTLRLVLIRGKEGSGRSTAVKWLRSQAEERHIPMYVVRLGRKNTRSDYSLWQRLFQLLTPRDFYVSKIVQCDFVSTMLEDIYSVGGISGSGAQIASSVLRSLLGVTYISTSHAASDSAGNTDHRTLSPAQILGALFKIFGYLLDLKSCIVVVENVEHCDDCSLKVLVELTKLDTPSVVVLTALDDVTGRDSERSPARSHVFTSARSSSDLCCKQDVLRSTAWNREYRVLIQALPSLQTILLESYSAEEIDKLLCETLGVASVPPEVALLVRDFSGESNFWVREFLQFITEHGAERFLAALGEKETTARNMYTSIDDVYNQHARTRPKLSPANSSNNLSSKPLSTSSRQLSRSSSMRSPTSNRSVTSPHQQQLDKLVLCRFGTLLPDAQRVLRTASIIGLTFSSTVLYGVLSAQLRELLVDNMQTLLNQKWLYQDSDNEALFQFAHTYAHALIYDLTPSSERRRVHKLVADFMENQNSSNDKSMYGMLSYHYQQCVPAKALMYAAMSMDTLLQVCTIFDYSDCLDLLTGAVPCCETAWDVRVLLKMVKRARVHVRQFELGNRRSEGQSWLARVYAVFAVFSRSPSTVLPESVAGKAAKYGSRSEEASDTLPVRTNSISSEASRESTDAADDLGYQRRTKRMMLQQLSRLSNQLSEQLACLTEEAEEAGAAGKEGAAAGMRDWQKQFLQEED